MTPAWTVQLSRKSLVQTGLHALRRCPGNLGTPSPAPQLGGSTRWPNMVVFTLEYSVGIFMLAMSLVRDKNILDKNKLVCDVSAHIPPQPLQTMHLIPHDALLHLVIPQTETRNLTQDQVEFCPL